MKGQKWVPVGQGFGHPPSLFSHQTFIFPSFPSAMIRGVTTKELYPEFDLDMND